jgi:hypothetical protein
MAMNQTETNHNTMFLLALARSVVGLKKLM